MTYSLGWTLCRNPAFLNRLSTKLRLGGAPEKHSIYLQSTRVEYGRTDIEVVSANLGTIVIEAKKGFTLPSSEQLEKYISAHKPNMYSKKPLRSIVVLTSFPEAVTFQMSALPRTILGIPVRYVSWRTICDLASRSIAEAEGSNRKQLREFIEYIRRLVTMRDTRSNLVYVVPLNAETFDSGDTTFIEVVEKYKKYFHPVGNRYPKEPPNYIGFRYSGKLQSIHFVERVTVITSYKKHFPTVAGTKLEPHFLYDLGPAIRPNKAVKSGPIRNMRCYCMLDTLLSEDSISDAYKETQRRLEEMP